MSSDTALRRRDLVALIAAAIAFIFATQSSPDASLQLDWYLTLPMAGKQSVAPLVSDLDGDGRGEVIILTPAPATMLRVYALPEKSEVWDPEALPVPLDKPLWEVDVLSGLRVAAGRRPVALAAGYLDPYDAASTQSRTQYVVVVREDWSVLLLDHELTTVWETPVGGHLEGILGGHRAEYELRDVAVLLTSHSADGDRDTGGTVVVSGLLQRKGLGERQDANTPPRPPLSDEAEAYLEHFSFYALEGNNGAVAWSHEGGGSPSAADAVATALGLSGASAASHAASHQYRVDPAAVSRELGPRASAALAGSAALSGGDRSSGNGGSSGAPREDWTVFRSSVLASMPHGWEAPDDTSLKLAHFARQHSGGRSASARLAAARHGAASPSSHKRSSSSRAGGRTGAGTGHGAAARGRGSGRKGGGLGSHGAAGHPAVRLPGLESVAAAASAATASGSSNRRNSQTRGGSGGSDSGGWQELLRPHDESEHWVKPNVIMAQSEHGLEAVALRGGRPIFSLALPRGGLYLDLNGDGTIDHLSIIGRRATPATPDDLARAASAAAAASSGEGGDGSDMTSPKLGDHLSGIAAHALAAPPGFVSGSSGGDRQQQLRRAHGRLPPCSALALSGVPAREQLFNGSLCDGAGHFHDLLHNPNHIGADRGREERARGRKARGHGLEVWGALPLAVPRDAHRRTWSPPTDSATGRAASAQKSHQGTSGGGGSGGSGSSGGRSAAPPQYDAVFALSNGVTTSYAPSGQLNWQTHDLPGWSEGHHGWLLRLPRARSDVSSGAGGDGADPHVHGDPHRADPLGMELLVVGESALAVLDARSGNLLAAAAVPQPPRRKPIIGDFDDDGAAEVLLVTEGAVWGYTVRFASGRGTAMRLLVVFLIAASLLVFVSQIDVRPSDLPGSTWHDKKGADSRHSRTSSGSWRGSDDRDDTGADANSSSRGSSSGSMRQRPAARFLRSTD